jgi:aminobenzoyl-glutamate transport protein
MMSKSVENKKTVSGFEKFIKTVEIVGNKLPHPFTLFALLTAIVLLLSFILAKMGVSVTYMAAGRAGEGIAEKTVAVTNLLSYGPLRAFIQEFVKIYVNFAPLGLIMVMMLGISLIEQTGLISALMRKTILGAPSYMVTAVLSIVGICANLASDAGIIFTPAIGGALYKALGRNPIVGIITGFAAATGGFTANLLIAGTDVLLSGITQSAAQGMGINAPVHPLINWYFMIAATAVLTLVTTLVTEKFTVRILGDRTAKADASDLKKHALTEEENKGLRAAGIAALICIAVLLLLAVPQNGFLRSDDGSIIPSSPLLKGVIAILFFFFFVVGTAYGKAAGIIKTEKDIPKLMQKGLQGSLSFLVVVLTAAIFVHFFNASNLTTILAVKGADALKAMNLTGIPLLVLFIILSTFVNLFITSGSAKWLILAPIFVPMFSIVGLSPAATQLAYRIGDSSTNIISPISYYIPVIIGLIEQYKSEEEKNTTGIGTVISLTMPYSLAYLVSLTALLIVWYLLRLPLGPGVSFFM